MFPLSLKKYTDFQPKELNDLRNFTEKPTDEILPRLDVHIIMHCPYIKSNRSCENHQNLKTRNRSSTSTIKQILIKLDGNMQYVNPLTFQPSILKRSRKIQENLKILYYI